MSTTFYIIDGDWYMEEDSGKPYMITGTNKCRQDMADTFLSEYDPVREIGCELANIEKIPVMLSGALQGIVHTKISEATDRLINYQKADMYSTADERIKNIEELRVIEIPSGQSMFYIRVTTEEGDTTADTVIPVSLKHLADFAIDDIFNISELLGE